MTQKNMRRWKCPHCGTEGYGDHWTTPHDTPNARSCRQSGQKSEAEIRNLVNAKIRKDWK